MSVAKVEIEVDTTQATKNAQALDAAMKALAKSTNRVPMTRVEWLVVAFVASQTIGNLALLGIAFALLRGH